MASVALVALVAFAALAGAFFAGASLVAFAGAFLAAAFAGALATGAAATLSSSMVMWLVRLLIRNARPCARGRNRFSVGPSSTYATAMTSESPSSCWLCSALATALASTLATGSLAAWGANWSTASASRASMPRMRSTTRRTFIGVMRTYRAVARARRSSATAVPCAISRYPSRFGICCR